MYTVCCLYDTKLNYLVSEPSIFDVGADKSQKVPNPKRSSPRDNLPDENLLTPGKSSKHFL
jgi:hypothetical protein